MASATAFSSIGGRLREGFEKVINSIHLCGGWDIYLMGSNAFLLSSDSVNPFTGCHREVHILPFCFGEYCSYFGEQGAVNDFDGPTATTTFRGSTASSAMPTGPFSCEALFRSSSCPIPPCWRG